MLAVLSEVNLLKPIPPAGLRSLTARGRNRTFRAGGRQVCQGEVSACLQIIVRGCVRVERSHPLLVEPVILAEVGVGGVVGELGMLEGEPGGDTVTAVEDTETVELEAGAVAATLLQFPEASASLLGCLSHRLRTPDDLAEQMVRRGWRSPTLTQPGGRKAGPRAPPDFSRRRDKECRWERELPLARRPLPPCDSQRVDPHGRLTRSVPERVDS